jgi:hypothetical protein
MSRCRIYHIDSKFLLLDLIDPNTQSFYLSIRMNLEYIGHLDLE